MMKKIFRAICILVVLLCFASQALGADGEIYKFKGYEGELQLVKSHSGWLDSWSSIVAGQFVGNTGRDSLLFYDKNTGVAALGKLFDDYGKMQIMKAYVWRKDWSIIVPCNVIGNSREEVLFYNGKTGYSELYTFDDNLGNMKLLATYQFNPGWTSIWRAWFHCIHDGSWSNEGIDGFWFYNSATGDTAYLQTIDKNYNMQQNFDRKIGSYQINIPGDFTGTGWERIFALNPYLGKGEFIDCTRWCGYWGQPEPCNYQYHFTNISVGRPWSLVTPGVFIGTYNTKYTSYKDDLLFYDRSNGVGELVVVNTDKDYRINTTTPLITVRTYQGWRKNWRMIISGNFVSGNGGDELLFYG